MRRSRLPLALAALGLLAVGVVGGTSFPLAEVSSTAAQLAVDATELETVSANEAPPQAAALETALKAGEEKGSVSPLPKRLPALVGLVVAVAFAALLVALLAKRTPAPADADPRRELKGQSPVPPSAAAPETPGVDTAAVAGGGEEGEAAAVEEKPQELSEPSAPPSPFSAPPSPSAKSDEALKADAQRQADLLNQALKRMQEAQKATADEEGEEEPLAKEAKRRRRVERSVAQLKQLTDLSELYFKNLAQLKRADVAHPLRQALNAAKTALLQHFPLPSEEAAAPPPASIEEDKGFAAQVPAPTPLPAEEAQTQASPPPPFATSSPGTPPAEEPSQTPSSPPSTPPAFVASPLRGAGAAEMLQRSVVQQRKTLALAVCSVWAALRAQRKAESEEAVEDLRAERAVAAAAATQRLQRLAELSKRVVKNCKDAEMAALGDPLESLLAAAEAALQRAPPPSGLKSLLLDSGVNEALVEAALGEEDSSDSTPRQELSPEEKARLAQEAKEREAAAAAGVPLARFRVSALRPLDFETAESPSPDADERRSLEERLAAAHRLSSRAATTLRNGVWKLQAAMEKAAQGAGEAREEAKRKADRALAWLSLRRALREAVQTLERQRPLELLHSNANLRNELRLAAQTLRGCPLPPAQVLQDAHRELPRCAEELTATLAKQAEASSKDDSPENVAQAAAAAVDLFVFLQETNAALAEMRAGEAVATALDEDSGDAAAAASSVQVQIVPALEGTSEAEATKLVQKIEKAQQRLREVAFELLPLFVKTTRSLASDLRYNTSALKHGRDGMVSAIFKTDLVERLTAHAAAALEKGSEFTARVERIFENAILAEWTIALKLAYETLGGTSVERPVVFPSLPLLRQQSDEEASAPPKQQTQSLQRALDSFLEGGSERLEEIVPKPLGPSEGVRPEALRDVLELPLKWFGADDQTPREAQEAAKNAARLRLDSLFNPVPSAAKESAAADTRPKPSSQEQQQSPAAPGGVPATASSGSAEKEDTAS